jgi:hypothetical protein
LRVVEAGGGNGCGHQPWRPQCWPSLSTAWVGTAKEFLTSCGRAALTCSACSPSQANGTDTTPRPSARSIGITAPFSAPPSAQASRAPLAEWLIPALLRLPGRRRGWERLPAYPDLSCHREASPTPISWLKTARHSWAKDSATIGQASPIRAAAAGPPAKTSWPSGLYIPPTSSPRRPAVVKTPIQPHPASDTHQPGIYIPRLPLPR